MPGVRVANQRRFAGRGIFGFFEHRFQPPGGSGKKETLDFAGQQLLR